MKERLLRELNLNTDPLEGIEIYAAKKMSAKGAELTEVINNNPGVVWLTPEKVDITTLKDCAEIIVERRQLGMLDFKIAKAVLKLIKEPRNMAEKRRVVRRK